LSVDHRQVPSKRNAPRRSPRKPEHLPPWSLAEPSLRKPPHPVWFCHQPACFRHILHTLRCALGPRIPWLQNPRYECRVPLVGFCQFNVPRAHHEHQRTPTSATGQRPLSDEQRDCTLRCVSAASSSRIDQPAHPLRGVMAMHHTFTRALRSSPHPHRDDRSSWWIYPRWDGPDTLCRRLILEPFGRTDRMTVRLPISEESTGQTCSTEAEHIEGLPAEARRETRAGERHPRCLPSPRTLSGTDVIFTSHSRPL
jgi:hypothetical protein